MTTTPTDATGATPQQWVMTRRTDPGGDEVLPGEQTAAGESGLGFLDMLDIINPLQHLPVIGTIYRALTGDTISDAARMAGGALYGGPLGVITALANVVVEAETGSDIGDNAMAWLRGPGAEPGSGEAPVTAALPATVAEPINAAPVTTAAALASPAAQAADIQRAALPLAGAPGAAASAVQAARDLSPEARPAKTEFQGRSANRLDAFIQQASAVRRSNPLAVGRGPASPAAAALAAANPAAPALGLPGAIDSSRLQAAALKPPASARPAGARNGQDDQELAVAGSGAGNVNQWMLRALDKYEHMRKLETS